MLAVAQPDFLLLSQSEFLGTKPGAFVVAITHRLMTAQTAGTPPVITGFEFEYNRLGFKDFGEIFHDFLCGCLMNGERLSSLLHHQISDLFGRISDRHLDGCLFHRSRFLGG